MLQKTRGKTGEAIRVENRRSNPCRHDRTGFGFLGLKKTKIRPIANRKTLSHDKLQYLFTPRPSPTDRLRQTVTPTAKYNDHAVASRTTVTTYKTSLSQTVTPTAPRYCLRQRSFILDILPIYYKQVLSQDSLRQLS